MPVEDPVAAAWQGPDSRSIELAAAPGLTSRSGMISLDLPPGTIRPVPGGLSDHHLTVVYLGPDLDDDAFAAACSRAKAAASSVPGPLAGTVQGVGSFTPSDGSEGKVPAFAPASVPGAKALRSKLEDLSASEHKNFVQHVTLAYVGKGDPLPPPVPKTSVKFSHLSVHRGDEVKRFPFAASEHAGGIGLSAETPALVATPAPYGKPGGPGLYGVKGQKHSNYYEHIVAAMMRKGKTKAEASAMAWGILRRWAAGGGKVHPEVRAAAAAALAQEAAKSGHSHANGGAAVDLSFIEQQHPRVAAGQHGGGQFGSKGGPSVAAARARHAPKVTPPVKTKAEPPGELSRIQQLRFQAASDRHLAHQILVKVGALVIARDRAAAGLTATAKAPAAPVSAAKSAAAKTAAATRKASGKTAVRKTSAAPHVSTAARLTSQIHLLRDDARLLIQSANHLDAQANGL